MYLSGLPTVADYVGLIDGVSESEWQELTDCNPSRLSAGGPTQTADPAAFFRDSWTMGRGPPPKHYLPKCPNFLGTFTGTFYVFRPEMIVK